jgi:hypothetical protein
MVRRPQACNQTGIWLACVRSLRRKPTLWFPGIMMFVRPAGDNWQSVRLGNAGNTRTHICPSRPSPSDTASRGTPPAQAYRISGRTADYASTGKPDFSRHQTLCACVYVFWPCKLLREGRWDALVLGRSLHSIVVSAQYTVSRSCTSP